MREKTCFIVGAGSFDGMRILPSPEDLVIAADGGYTYLHQMGMEPDLLLGDFDSLKELPPQKTLIRHPSRKDDTDMALAAAYAIGQGAGRFFLYGGLGGRLDHTLANLQLLTRLSRRGAEAYLIGEQLILTAITAETVGFSPECSGVISVFCMGESAFGVRERGLSYTLNGAQLTCDRALGVSNEFTGQDSEISVSEGTLLLVWEEKNGLPVFRKKREENGRQNGG